MNKILSKKYLTFITILFLIGIISGILYYYSLNDSMRENVINTINSYQINSINNIFKHLIILSIIVTLSFMIIGIPLSMFYLYYEGISIGFVITLFTIKNGFNGMLYGLLYSIFTKLIFIFLLFVFTKKVLNVSKNIVSYLVYKHQNNYKNNIINNFKNSLYIILFILLNDVIIYFLSIKVLKMFDFLIY